MILKGCSGAIDTSTAFTPSEPIHLDKGLSVSLSSSAMRLTSSCFPVSVNAVAVSRSSKKNLEPLSLSIIKMLEDVKDGASGATAAPAARTPQNAAPHLIEL